MEMQVEWLAGNMARKMYYVMQAGIRMGKQGLGRGSASMSLSGSDEAMACGGVSTDVDRGCQLPVAASRSA